MKGWRTGGLVLLLVLGLLDHGLYFDEGLLPFHLGIVSATLLLIVYRWLRGTLGSWKALLPFAMCVAFLLPLCGTPASVKGTVDHVMRWASYGCLAYWLYAWVVQEGGVANRRQELQHALLGFGAFLTLTAWLGFYGVFSYSTFVLQLPESVSGLGVRLDGFFQYANAMAAVTGAFWLFHLVAVLQGPGVSKRPRILLAWTAWPLVPLMAALLATESRGAWLLLALVWFLGLCLLPVRQQILYLVLSTVNGGAGLGAYVAVAAGYQHHASLFSIYVLAAVTVVATWVTVFVASKLSQYEWKKRRVPYLRVLLPAGLVVLAIALALDLAMKGLVYQTLPEPLQRRITQSLGTLFARQLFAQDGWTLFRQSPWIGWGGGAWAQLYTKVQQQPYVGNEVHDGFLDLLLDVGVVGFAIWLSLGVMWVRRLRVQAGGWPRLLSGVLPVAMVLGHSLVDFDLSFGEVWFLLLSFAALALASSKTSEPLEQKARHKRVTRGARGNATSTSPATKAKPRTGWPVNVAAGAVMLVLLGTLTCAVRAQLGVQAHAAAANASDPAEAATALSEAISWEPYNVTYRLELADSLSALEQAAQGHSKSLVSQRIETLKQAIVYEPFQPTAHWGLAVASRDAGLTEQATQELDRALQDDPFSKTKQEQGVRLLVQMAEQAKSKGETAQAKVIAEHAVTVYERYAALAQQMKQKGVQNDRGFVLTNAATLDAQQAYQLAGQAPHSPVK